MCAVKVDKKYAYRNAKKVKGQVWYSEKHDWMYSHMFGDELVVFHSQGTSRHCDLESFLKMHAIVVLKEDFSRSQKVWRWWNLANWVEADYSTPLATFDEKLKEIGWNFND